MLISRNVEGMHGHKKVGNPCPKPGYLFIVLTTKALQLIVFD